MHTSDEDLVVAIYWSYEDWKDLRNQTDEVLKESSRTAQRLEDTCGRIRRLARELGVAPAAGRGLGEDNDERGRKAILQTPKPLWNEIREDAERRLKERGIAPATIDIDDLLDPEVIRRIESRFSGTFSVEARLDRYDLAMVFAAGLTAALVDLLIVRIPLDIRYLGHNQTGSPLTKWLHNLEVPSDNWLASWFKVSYDKLISQVAGMTPQYHRLITLGHDPLLGLVVGTIDILRGGLTAISADGAFAFRAGQAASVYNPLIAFVLQIGHMLSDGFTAMGLPAPGWGLTQILQFGNFGARERTLAETARFMYLKGFDSRHFLTMSSSVATAEVVLRSYFALRQYLDESYRDDVSHQAAAAATKNTGEHPRFQAMALGAHAIGAALNAGKIAAYGCNPLAFNYAQWLRFVHAMYRWISTKRRSPTKVITGQSHANLEALERGWPDIGASDADFPVLTLVNESPGL